MTIRLADLLEITRELLQKEMYQEKLKLLRVLERQPWLAVLLEITLVAYMMVQLVQL